MALPKMPEDFVSGPIQIWKRNTVSLLLDSLSPGSLLQISRNLHDFGEILKIN